jgi:hypothetical protein
MRDEEIVKTYEAVSDVIAQRGVSANLLYGFERFKALGRMALS